MIGGYVLVPLVDNNGVPVGLTSTEKTVKTGTYNKIIRALKMNKEVIFDKVQISTFPFTTLTGCTAPFKNPTIDGEPDCVIFRAYNISSSSGALYAQDVYVTSKDTAYVIQKAG